MPADRTTLTLHSTVEQMRAVAQDDPHETMRQRYKVVAPFPPWDHRREWLRVIEVPAYLARLYGMRCGDSAVNKWWKKGVPAPTPSDPERRVYLVTKKVRQYRMVRKSDLLAFLELD